MRLSEINHFSHSHRLLLVSTDSPFRCDGCKELGFALCYQCPIMECNFHLHEECGNATSYTSHPFMKKCNFKFLKGSQGLRVCDACGIDINGFLYQCSHKYAHDLHPCCAKLPKSLSTYNDGQIILSNTTRSKCLKCKRKETANGIKGWSYVSSCGKYCYHVACVKEAIVENWSMANFGQFEVANSSNALQVQSIGSSQVVAVQGGGSRWRKVRKLWRILKLVVSAIFGDPVSLAFSLVQVLSN